MSGRPLPSERLALGAAAFALGRKVYRRGDIIPPKPL
jgi:hypothetical protein